MKKIIFVVMVLLFCSSCTVSNETKKMSDDNSIVYILPSSVENALKHHIEAMKNKDQIYFCLYKDSGFFQIYVSEYNSANPFVARTNRKVFLAGSFYPIIFEFDIFFGTSSKVQDIEDDYHQNKYTDIKRTYIVNEGFSIIFDKAGNIANSKSK